MSLVFALCCAIFLQDLHFGQPIKCIIYGDVIIWMFSYSSQQRGQAVFDLQAISQKRKNLRATSNKIMYKTTDLQDVN